MRSEIVKELFCFGQSIGCRLCLLGRYGADCSENSAVDRSTVEEELPTDLLNDFFVSCADCDERNEILSAQGFLPCGEIDRSRTPYAYGLAA